MGQKNLLYLICCPSASAALPAGGEGPTCHVKQRRQQMLSAPRKCCHSNSTCIFYRKACLEDKNICILRRQEELRLLTDKTERFCIRRKKRYDC